MTEQKSFVPFTQSKTPEERIAYVKANPDKYKPLAQYRKEQEESKKLDYSAAIDKYKFLSKKFDNKVGLIHGAMDKYEKDNVLNNFLNKSTNILVSTTVIEEGIDFPNAYIIVIENAN